MEPTIDGRGLSDAQKCRLTALWAKQRGGFALLLEHMLDSAAVGELIWDRFLSRATRETLDTTAAGRGRALFAWLCGVHDIGKAAPSFQGKVDALARRVQASGLTWRTLRFHETTPHHTHVGAKILRRELAGSGWSLQMVEWVWPMVDGHHGMYHRLADVEAAPPNAVGRGEAWRDIQRVLLEIVAREVGFADLRDAAPAQVPPVGIQLGLSGLIVMADWIASNTLCRGGETDLDRISMPASRERATRAWRALELRGGWELYEPGPRDLVRERFAMEARSIQTAMVEVAEEISGPGILVLEAEMGQGKTIAALVGTEVLSRRFGCGGLFDGMPTQATSDSMFEEITPWAERLAPGIPVALSHGKRHFNRRWQELVGEAPAGAIDEFEDRGTSGSGPSNLSVVTWLMGRHRALLTPVCIGTVDNLLHAVTRTPYVALRFAGLLGKVVVLDEVHAYSIYMRRFLDESLRWLGSAGVPVIVLTATLPPEFRRQMIAAYLTGRHGSSVEDFPLPEAAGYPLITWATSVGGKIDCGTRALPPDRPSRRIVVDVLPDDAARRPASLVDLLRDRLAEGGRVLVVRNTVGRAQSTYRELHEHFGEDVELLHARLITNERAERTERERTRLGSGGQASGRHILVATQVAEQSFDIDVDILITDVAPIDLVLQRAGRMHRHADRDPHRPARLRNPQIVVTGMTLRAGAAPVFPYGVGRIYSPRQLLRATAIVLAARDRGGWSFPEDIPLLVTDAYGDTPLTPVCWDEVVQEADAADGAARRTRECRADDFLFGFDEAVREGNLQGRHRMAADELPDDDRVAAVVRDGPETVEVLLVRKDAEGMVTLTGRRLTSHGRLTDDPDAVREAMGSTLRLPQDLTEEALNITSPATFRGHGYLNGMRPLVLDEERGADFAGREVRVRYDSRIGLVRDRPGSRHA